MATHTSRRRMRTRRLTTTWRPPAEAAKATACLHASAPPATAVGAVPATPLAAASPASSFAACPPTHNRISIGPGASMAADALSIIPGAVLRNLSDKLYEKRKNAALEIEGIVKQLPMASEHEKISAVKSLLPTISPTRCEPSEGWVDWPCSSYCRTRAKRWPVKRRRRVYLPMDHNHAVDISHLELIIFSRVLIYNTSQI
ncbi:hypothetical protein SETIT_7G203500v2 [Setaria italica]|uniref:Uncharacterized protein n=1 Tax=Setaria italica TaxID=4555 RepID=A0A368RXS2_SETIT|nr:uncharacterized protein LOC101772510 isoform X2 [Setaria italica]RCV34996.1 hypothetical protein SETIT_7G203500v2 [Setaria italica]